MSNTDNVLECRALKKAYKEGPQDILVLRHIELAVAKGERVAIIGTSGAGKSTLLNLLGGLDSPSAGEVFVNGESLSQLDDNGRGRLRNRYLGFVYQFHHLLGEFTALENVAMPLLIGNASVPAAQQRAQAMLEQVGLGERLHHKPAELSGGERQRVAIARAIVTKPSCVLMDEPTGNLDRETAESIEQLLAQLNRDHHISFVIVTHDQTLAATMDRVLVLSGGELNPMDTPLHV